MDFEPDSDASIASDGGELIRKLLQNPLGERVTNEQHLLTLGEQGGGFLPRPESKQRIDIAQSPKPFVVGRQSRTEGVSSMSLRVSLPCSRRIACSFSSNSSFVSRCVNWAYAF